MNAGAKPCTMKNYIRACDTSKHIALMCDRFQLVGWVQIHPNQKEIPPTRDGISFWRREWDSNPRYVAVSLVFKTSSLNRSDISPKIPEYYSMKNLFCQSNNKLVQTWSGFARLRAFESYFCPFAHYSRIEKEGFAFLRKSPRRQTVHRTVCLDGSFESLSDKQKEHTVWCALFVWRRERDSNPRRSLSPYTISSRAP